MVLHADADATGAGTPVTAESPARPGETVVVWSAGLGAVDDSDAPDGVRAGQPFAGPDAAVLHPVSATIGEQSATVLAAQLPPGSIGIYQVRVSLPADLPDNPQTPLVLSQEGNSSNTVMIPVRNSIQ